MAPPKILLLADSLALPRGPQHGNVPYESTYPYLLELKLRCFRGVETPLLINAAMRARTILDVLNDWEEHVELKRPDVVIVHVGICDCAPRVFSNFEHKVIGLFRPVCLRDLLLKWVHKHRPFLVRLRRNRVYVSASLFEQKVREVVSRSRDAKLQALLFVNVVAPPDHAETRSPGSQRNVARYNEILGSQADGRKVFIIDLDRLVRENGGAAELTCDGQHINSRGHQLLAQELENYLLRFCRSGLNPSPARAVN